MQNKRLVVTNPYEKHAGDDCGELMVLSSGWMWFYLGEDYSAPVLGHTPLPRLLPCRTTLPNSIFEDFLLIHFGTFDL